MLQRIALLICLCLLATPLSAAELSGTVDWVYDGDTLRIKDIGTVRLLGIDCPESKNFGRDRYYQHNFQISRKQLRRVAKQAKRFNIEQVKGQHIRLELDKQETDKYGRLLAYLYLPDGRMLNQLLLEKGLASVFRRYQFSQKEFFLALEATAREQQRGLWQQ